MPPVSTKGSKGLITPKSALVGIVAVVVLLVLALATTIYFTIRNNVETEAILIDSVKSELVSSCIGAREILFEDLDLFEKINSQEDIDANYADWTRVVENLAELNDEIGGEYIYALKEIDGEYYFIFDTDPELRDTHTVFDTYEIFPVHERAFAGEAAADVMNVEDQWGSFNTGALPLYNSKGEHIGIISTDISDTFIQRSRATSTTYSATLIIVTSVAVVVMLIILFMLIRRNARMQRHLFLTANYDPISGLPNRNNLFSFLSSEIDSLKAKKHPVGVFFVDLDNFKSVNDNAGHDAGDDLLRKIATFLNKHAEESTYASSEVMDPLTARIGGDEFLQLMPGVSTKEEAERYAATLLKAFAEQPELRRFVDEFNVGLSIGISLFPSMSDDYDMLIKYADIAMYYAKKNGKNNFRVYEDDMDENVEGADLIVRNKDRK